MFVVLVGGVIERDWSSGGVVGWCDFYFVSSSWMFAGLYLCQSFPMISHVLKDDLVHGILF